MVALSAVALAGALAAASAGLASRSRRLGLRGSSRQARPSGAATRSGCSRWREQLDALDQARAGARERRRGVDGDDALGAERVEPSRCASACSAPRRRRGRTASRRRPRAAAAATSSQRDGARLAPGLAEHVVAARQRDHLRHPVAAGERRVEPLERRDARARRARRRRPRTRRAAPRSSAAQRLAALAARPSPRRAATSSRTSPSVSGSSEITCGRRSRRSATARTSS